MAQFPILSLASKQARHINQANIHSCSLQPMAKLFLWVSRSLAFGIHGQEEISARLAPALGQASDSALAYHYAFLRTLAAQAKRTLKIHSPGCPNLSLDELLILQIMGAFERHNREHADAYLRELVPDTSTAQLADQAATLALLYAPSCANTSRAH